MLEKRYFGSHRGREVYELILSNGLLQVGLLSYGATLRSLVFGGVDLCLGYDHLGQYVSGDGYIGACVGRHANRIAGSRFVLNGREYLLSANEGENQLHGGREGFSHKVWDFRAEEDRVSFYLESPHGDEGFPGRLQTEICFRLEGSSLIIDYRAISDRDTVVNLTNHAYFNLSGHDSGEIYAQQLQVNARCYTPCGPGTIPTGRIAELAGSALDFRSMTVLGDRLNDDSLALTQGLDHNFVLEGSPAAILRSPLSGIEMTVETDMEGIQLYSAGFLSTRPGKKGAIYGRHHALCLETQHFPDAVNHPNFPSPILRAGEEYSHSTKFSFRKI